MSAAEKYREAEKILKRCDMNDDGYVDKEEFQAYYDKQVVAMTKFHKGRAAKEKTKQQTQSSKAMGKPSAQEQTEEQGALEDTLKQDEATAPRAAPAPDPQVVAQLAVLNARAQKKWNQLDVDENGRLDGKEVLALAEWVWCSFRPGQTISSKERFAQADRIMKKCDKNDDGFVDQGEFAEFYEQAAASMFKFHKGRAEEAKSASAQKGSAGAMQAKQKALREKREKFPWLKHRLGEDASDAKVDGKAPLEGAEGQGSSQDGQRAPSRTAQVLAGVGVRGRTAEQMQASRRRIGSTRQNVPASRKAAGAAAVLAEWRKTGAVLLRNQADSVRKFNDPDSFQTEEERGFALLRQVDVHDVSAAAVDAAGLTASAARYVRHIHSSAQ